MLRTRAQKNLGGSTNVVLRDELVAVWQGSKTRVVLTSSPGYASMPPALRFIYAVLVPKLEGSGLRILMAAPNQELEPLDLRDT